MKRITLTDQQWEVFYGALRGMKLNPYMAKVYEISPLFEEAVTAVQNAEDVNEEEGAVIERLLEAGSAMASELSDLPVYYDSVGTWDEAREAYEKKEG